MLEAEMNISPLQSSTTLRQLDWRFLLPHGYGGAFRHLVLLGGSPGLAQRIVEIGLAARVSCEIPEKQSADALVILSNMRDDLTQAMECLIGGGVLYCEVDRRTRQSFARTPGRVRSLLQGMGCTQISTYWVKPNFVQYQMYLPLSVRGAIRWYLETLYTANTLGRRLLEPVLHMIARLGNRAFEHLLPCYAVTAFVGAVPKTPASIFASHDLPAELQHDVYPLLVTSGDDERGRVVALPFTPDGNKPIVVLKTARRGEFNEHTEHEQRTLRLLHTSAGGAVARTIPGALGVVYDNDLVMSMETYASGQCLSASSGRWHAPIKQKMRDLQLVTAWVTDFSQQTQDRIVWDTNACTRWLDAPLKAYKDAFGVTQFEKQLFDSIRVHAHALIGLQVPIVCQHHDFGEWNMYRNGDELTVIDWERARMGPAFYDLIYFLTHWSYTARHLRGDTAQLRGFRELFVDTDANDGIVRACREAMHWFLGQLAIDCRFFPILLVLSWVEHACDRIERQRLVGELPAHSRTGNRYVAYIGILAEHGEHLLAAADWEWLCGS